MEEARGGRGGRDRRNENQLIAGHTPPRRSDFRGRAGRKKANMKPGDIMHDAYKARAFKPSKLRPPHIIQVSGSRDFTEGIPRYDGYPYTWVPVD